MIIIKHERLLETKAFAWIFMALLFCVAAVSSVSAQTHTRAEWITKYDALNQGLNGGAGYSSSSDSSTLAWAQSNILLSYLNMYEATQNTSYLNTFVSQVNTMIGTMDDANNDGYNGWDTEIYSVNILRNSGAENVDLANADTQVPKTLHFEENFETPSGSDSTLPAGWTRWQSNSTTAYLDSSNADAGTYGCTVKTRPAAGWQVIEKVITYEADRIYLVKFRGKIAGTGSKGYISVEDATTSAILGKIDFDNTAWQDLKFVFFAPAATGRTVKIKLFHTAWNVDNFSAHFDNIKSYRLDGNLLPEYWTRWQSTASTAYMDFTAANTTEGKAGFTIATNPGYGWQALESALKNLLVNDNQNYEPGITYKVSFSARTSTASLGWQLLVKDFTSGQTLLSKTGTNTAWSSFNGTFIAPAVAGHDVRVRLYHTAWMVAGSAYFDDIKVTQYAEYAAHDGMVGMAMAKFIMMVYKGQAPASYTASADTFWGILENHLIPKWDYLLTQIDSSKSVYLMPDNGAFAYPNSSLPHNQYLALTSTYAFLARAIDGQSKADYTALAGKLAGTFASKLRTVSDDAYEWNYWDDLLPADYADAWIVIEDSSHANVDILSAIYCRQAGIVMTDADLNRFTNTFIHKMWNGSTTNPCFGTTINTNGTNTISQYTSYGWIQLGAFDRQIYDLIRTMHDLIWSDSANMTWRRMLVISEIIKGVLIFNEPFETPNSQDNTLPDGWTRWQSNSSTAYLDSANEFEGANSLTVKTNGTSWQIIQKPIAYVPGATYQVRLMGKVAGNPAAGGKALVYDLTAASNVASAVFTNTAWNQTVFTFTAPAVSGHDVRLRLYTSIYNVTDGIVHFDNVEIREIK